LLVSFLRSRNDPARCNILIRRLSLLVLALALLSKIILNARIHHYGFALAMPACLLLVIILLNWIPELISRLGGAGWIFRAAALAMLMSMTAAYLSIHHHYIQLKTVPVADNRCGILLADRRGEYLNATIERIRSSLEPGQTMAVLPEGVMLNYLCRTPNPTPYVNFMPLEIALFGEDRILAAFDAHPPDFVVLVHKNTLEYGYRFFGQDYGRALFGWVNQHYQPVFRAGAMPFQDDRFGILLLQKR